MALPLTCGAAFAIQDNTAIIHPVIISIAQMNKHQICSLAAWLMLFFPIWSNAQSMALTVLGASGGTSGAGDNSLTWTVGEAITMNALQGDIYLGAGFQQARKRRTTVGVFSVFTPALDIKAYPNPAGDQLTIEAPERALSLRLCDLLGRQVISNHPMQGMGQLNLSHLPTGIYVLQAFDEKGRLVASTKIQHVEN